MCENITTFVLIGDLHLRPKSVKSFLSLQEKALSFIREKRPDYTVFMGDLLDTNDIVKISVYNLLLSFFEKILSLSKIIIIIGNHDYSNSTQFLSNAHIFNPLKKWKGVTVVDKPIFIDENLFVPFVPEGRFMEAISQVDWKNAENIFCHQAFKEVVSFGKDSWKKTFPQIISGHIHSYCKKENILYTGSSLQVSVSENPDKYLWFVSGEKILKRKLDIPGKKSVKIQASDFEKLKIEGIHEYQIEIMGTISEIKKLEQTKKFRDTRSKHNIILVAKKSEEKKVDKSKSFLKILNTLLTEEENSYRKSVMKKPYIIIEE